MAIPRFIPLEQASALTSIPVEELRALAESGKIEAAKFDGRILVSELDARRESDRKAASREELPAYQEVRHLRGIPIGVSEASRKYKMSHSTISRWKDKGWLRTIGRDGQKVLLDEGDVAYCVGIYKQRAGKKGKKIFSESGLPK